MCLMIAMLITVNNVGVVKKFSLQPELMSCTEQEKNEEGVVTTSQSQDEMNHQSVYISEDVVTYL